MWQWEPTIFCNSSSVHESTKWYFRNICIIVECKKNIKSKALVRVPHQIYTQKHPPATSTFNFITIKI